MPEDRESLPRYGPVAARIAEALTAAGYPDSRTATPLTKAAGPAFYICGAVVCAAWMNPDTDDCAPVLAEFTAVLRAAGLSVDTRTDYLYVTAP